MLPGGCLAATDSQPLATAGRAHRFTRFAECRDHSCDIRIVNKEISRKHAEVYVEDNGAVSGGALSALCWRDASFTTTAPASSSPPNSAASGAPLHPPCRCSSPRWAASPWPSMAPP